MSQETYTVQLIATLTDVNGNPLSGMTIYFYYRKHGETNWTLIRSETTDANGQATVTHTLPGGVYDFRAEFPGTDKYAPSEDIVENVQVGKIPTVLKLEVHVLSS